MDVIEADAASLLRVPILSMSLQRFLAPDAVSTSSSSAPVVIRRMVNRADTTRP